MTSYLHPYNSKWPQRFQQESKLIKQDSSIDLALYHIGSTAIKGLYAKDCIDMLGVIESFEQGEFLIKALESLGYEFRGEYGIKGRHYFAKKQPDKFHLHIFAKGSGHIKRHLNYVKVMSNNLKLIEEFNNLKQQLFNRYPNDKSIYQQQKSCFYDKYFES